MPDGLELWHAAARGVAWAQNNLTVMQNLPIEALKTMPILQNLPTEGLKTIIKTPMY
jgi:hypothetical protein